MRALIFGQPFAATLLEEQVALHSLEFLPTYDLKGTRMAFIRRRPNEADEVVVRNLATSEHLTLCGSGRERVNGIILTSTAIAFVTFSGLLYVRDLRNDHNETQCRRLPSAQVNKIAGHAETFAVVLASKPGNTAVVVYSGLDQKLRIHDFSSQMPGSHDDRTLFDGANIMVDSARQLVDIIDSSKFATADDDVVDLLCRHRRFSLRSDASTTTVTQSTTRMETSHRFNTLGHPHSSGSRDQFTLDLLYSSGSGQWFPTTVGQSRQSLAFDAASTTLTVTGCQPGANSPSHLLPGVPSMVHYVRWKDAIYATGISAAVSVFTVEDDGVNLRYVV